MKPNPFRRRAVLTVLTVLVALAAAAAGLPAHAQRFDLVTADEAAFDREARAKSPEPDIPPVTRSRSFGAAPTSPLAIRVVAPNVAVTQAAPVRIELAFMAPPGAKVVPSTFRLLYGQIKLDLTERLRRFASVSESGVVVEQAVLPEGLHRLIVQVADDQGHVAEQELRLRVAARS